MPFVVKNKAHVRGKEKFEVGDVIEPTPEELMAFPDRFEEQAAPAAASRKQSATQSSE